MYNVGVTSDTFYLLCTKWAEQILDILSSYFFRKCQVKYMISKSTSYMNIYHVETLCWYKVQMTVWFTIGDYKIDSTRTAHYVIGERSEPT